MINWKTLIGISLVISLLSLFFLAGCTKLSDKEKAIKKCIELCKDYKNSYSKNINFSKGPCLSNKIIDDWVCDVAHNPRQEVDNLPENQCSAFREGNAKHFVEVDEDCKLIKTY